MSEGFFFVLSKLVWAVISPDSLIVLTGVGAWLCLALGWVRLGRRLISVAALLLITIGFFPIDEWLMVPLETRFPANSALPARVDGIIVLGGAISPTRSDHWGQVEMDAAADRVSSFVYLAGVYPEARLVFAGGSGELAQQELREAEFAAWYFGQMGLGDREIVYERDSRNTVENVINSRALVDPRLGENWILITSAFHMPRAVGIFCRQDWPVFPYPVDHYTEPGSLWRVKPDFADNLLLMKVGLREWLGLLAYRVTGRTDRLLPGERNYCGVESSS